MDQRKLELHKRGMELRLHGPHLDDDRATYLSDYQSVLRDLAAANGEGWDLAFATVVHIAYADGFLDELVTEFKERSLTHVERLEAETYGDRPTLQLRQDEPPVTYDLNPRWLTYIWCRIAIGVMTASDDPCACHQAVRGHRSPIPSLR